MTKSEEMRRLKVKRLGNKNDILHRTASGEVKLTAQYWELKGEYIRSGDKEALASFEKEVEEYKKLMIKDEGTPNLTKRSVIFNIERKQRLDNKDEVLRRTDSGEVELTAQYYKIKEELIQAGDRGALAAFEDEVEEYKRLMMKNEDTPNLTNRSVISRIAETKVEKFLLNTGYTAEDLAIECKLGYGEILNPENWRDSKFFAKDGRVFEVVFNYNGSIFREIK